MNLRILAFAAALAVAFVPSARGVVRPGTTSPSDIDIIDVTITDSRIILSEDSGERGTQADFHVQNLGKRPHNFVLVGGNIPGAPPIIGLAREGLGTPMLKPKQTWVLQLFLDLRGTYLYRSTAKADRAKPGMHGRFSIT